MAGYSKYIGPGSWGDPDFLEPGYFWMGESDRQTEFSFWCLFGAPLMVATDVRELSNKAEILNAEVIAINQDPLGKVGDLYYNGTDGGQIWSRPLSGGRWAAILYNSNVWFESAIIKLTFTPALLPGWPASATKANVRDVWAKKSRGVLSSFKADLSAHQSIMFVLSPAA